MFQLTHPGPTSRDGRGYPALQLDRPGDPDDANYVLCAQCGLANNSTQVQMGDSFDSPGLNLVKTTVHLVPTIGGSVQVYEEQVVGGCPFCGSLNQRGYNKMQPYSRRDPFFRRFR